MHALLHGQALLVKPMLARGMGTQHLTHSDMADGEKQARLNAAHICAGTGLTPRHICAGTRAHPRPHPCIGHRWYAYVPVCRAVQRSEAEALSAALYKPAAQLLGAKPKKKTTKRKTAASGLVRRCAAGSLHTPADDC